MLKYCVVVCEKNVKAGIKANTLVILQLDETFSNGEVIR